MMQKKKKKATTLTLRVGIGILSLLPPLILSILTFSGVLFFIEMQDLYLKIKYPMHPFLVVDWRLLLLYWIIFGTTLFVLMKFKNRFRLLRQQLIDNYQERRFQTDNVSENGQNMTQKKKPTALVLLFRGSVLVTLFPIIFFIMLISGLSFFMFMGHLSYYLKSGILPYNIDTPQLLSLVVLSSWVLCTTMGFLLFKFSNRFRLLLQRYIGIFQEHHRYRNAVDSPATIRLDDADSLPSYAADPQAAHEHTEYH